MTTHLYIHNRRRMVLGVALMVIGVMAITTPAGAVESIHDVFWHLGDGNIPGTGKVLGVTFDATITAADASGLNFSILETGSQQELVAFDAPDLGPIPSAGTPVTLSFFFNVQCGSDGSLGARQSSMYGTFCGAVLGSGYLYDPSLPGVWSSGVGSGPFTLAVADASGSTAGNLQATVQCAATSMAQTDPFVTAKQQRQERLDLLAGDGDSGTIGIYFDPEGTICNGEVLPDVPTTLYVVARLNGVSGCGFAGTEFRFAGVPATWTVFPVAPEEALTLGNPFTIGVNVAFGTCQTTETRVLYTVLVLADEYEQDVMFTIEPRNPPSNLRLSCPLMNMCDGPFYSGVCIDGLMCHINPSSPKACAQVTSVDERTWGAVKRMYQE